MALTCACPSPASITSIPAFTCDLNFGQIQKMVFQRTFASPGVLNWFNFVNGPVIYPLASWQTLKAATGNTKVTISPFFGAATSEAGDDVTFGGGNETVNGIEMVLGTNPSTFSGVFYKTPQHVISALKAYECEKDLSVFFLTADGAILGQSPTPTATQPELIRGFQVESLSIKDAKLATFDSPLQNAFSLKLPAGWALGMVKVIPEFNPLTAL